MQQIELKYLEIYGYSDPAAGKEARNQRRTARQTIVIGARDWLSRWFFLYIWAGRLTTSDFKRKILDIHEQYSCRRFGLEANGMQVLFGGLIRDEARERFGPGNMKFVPIYQPTNVDKNYRIRTGIEPALNMGRIFLRESDVDARSEFAGFPTAQTKDIIDSIETLVSRVAPKRTESAAASSEEGQYAKYLRESGMPAYLIEQEMARYRAQLAVGLH